MTVRDIFVEDVIKKWDLRHALVLKVSGCDHGEIAEKVLEYIRSGR
jgi:hypothetical protein